MAAAPVPPHPHYVIEHREVDIVTSDVVEEARKKPGAMVLEARIKVSFWNKGVFTSNLVECNAYVPAVAVALPNRTNLLVNVLTLKRDPRETLL